MVMDSHKSPVNDPRRSPIHFVKNMVKGRRTPTKGMEDASIDVCCDESTQPNIKSVRPNSSRRTSRAVMEDTSPDSPVQRRSKRIQRTKQRVVEAKSRDRLSEYSNSSPKGPTKTKHRSSTSSVPRDQSRSPVVHVVETKKKTSKSHLKSYKQQRNGSPTSLDAEMKSSMAKHKDHAIMDSDADESILPQVSVVPVITADKSNKEGAQSKKVRWDRGVQSDADSSAEGTYDDMTVDTEWSVRSCTVGRNLCLGDGNFTGEIFDELLDCGYFCKCLADELTPAGEKDTGTKKVKAKK